MHRLTTRAFGERIAVVEVIEFTDDSVRCELANGITAWVPWNSLWTELRFTEADEYNAYMEWHDAYTTGGFVPVMREGVHMMVSSVR